jgi:hypothetical protein
VRLRAADGGELVGVVVGVGDMSTVDIRHIDEPVQVVIEIGLRTICDRATGDGDRVAIAVGVQVIDYRWSRVAPLALSSMARRPAVSYW